MKRFQNKIVVVTGGNSGIGKGIAKQFIEEGAQVIIMGRNVAKLDETHKELGERLLAYPGDVTQLKDIQGLYQFVSEKFQHIDVVVANAGIGGRKPVDEVTEEDFEQVVNTNYRGTYFTAKYALPYLKPKASMIFIASCAAQITMKRHSVYASSKAAIIKLAKSLTFDLSDRQIRVNTISPGYIETPIFTARLAQNPHYLDEKKANIPLQRIGTPQDIAHAAAFLASEEASYISGVDLLVDGGYAASFPCEL